MSNCLIDVKLSDIYSIDMTQKILLREKQQYYISCRPCVYVRACELLHVCVALLWQPFLLFPFFFHHLNNLKRSFYLSFYRICDCFSCVFVFYSCCWFITFPTVDGAAVAVRFLTYTSLFTLKLINFCCCYRCCRRRRRSMLLMARFASISFRLMCSGVSEFIDYAIFPSLSSFHFFFLSYF